MASLVAFVPLAEPRGLPPHPLLWPVASGKRAENIARARELLMPPIIPVDAIKAISPNATEPEPQTTNLCPCCGGRMVIIERFERGATPHYRASPPPPAIRIDTS